MFKTIIARFFLFFIICFIVFSSVFFFFEYSVFVREINFKREEMIDIEKGNIDFEIASISQELSSVVSDLMYLSSVFELEYNDRDNSSQIVNTWKTFAEAKKVYDQVRFLDASGVEVLRINYDNSTGKSAKVLDSELQDKSEKNYFKRALNLEDNGVYISVLNLNMENGVIQKPLKPVIRFAKKVFDSEGKVLGVVVINYRASNIIDKFKMLENSSFGSVVVLKNSGHYIYSKNSVKNWSFLFPEKSKYNYSLEQSARWKVISTAGSGSKMFDDNLVVFSDLDISKLELYEGFNVVTDEKPVKIVTTIRARDNGLFVIKDSLDGYIYFISENMLQFLLVVLISILAAIILVYTASRKDEIVYFSEYDPLTEVYNRRAGYKLLDKMIETSLDAGKDFSLCFIDINGLKTINDNLGHEYGDEIIVTVSNVIKSEIRDSDILIRLGGDEFLLGLSGSNYNRSEQIWKRIKERFDNINTNEERTYNISVSHGIVELYDNGEESIENAIIRADELMYVEKQKIKEKLIVLK